MQSAETEFYVGDVLEYFLFQKWRGWAIIVGKIGYILKSGKNAGKVRYYYELLFPEPIKDTLFPDSLVHDIGLLKKYHDKEDDTYVTGIAAMNPGWVQKIGERFRLVHSEGCYLGSDNCNYCEYRFKCATNYPSKNNRCEHMRKRDWWNNRAFFCDEDKEWRNSPMV